MDSPQVSAPGFSSSVSTAPRAVLPLEPEPPAWVTRLFTRQGGEPRAHPRHPLVDVVERDRLARVTTRVPDAAGLPADELTALVADRYTVLDRVLREIDRHPLRIWNYVPGIVDPIAPGLDRYMAFNRGRFQSYADTWGLDGRFERATPTASAVGIAGPDLVIDCLASSAAGEPVDNPRQIAPWRYSRRYGPRPPCFARGTIATLARERVLLVGGTASIVGEESRHPGDVRAQAAEALANIEAVIANAGARAGHPLRCLTDARVYVVNAGDAAIVEGLVRAGAGAALRMETRLARVCRPELLVEIEGLAVIGRSASI